MTGQPLIIVSLSIAHEKEAAFNDFYHHSYIPKLVEIVPEIKSVWRYEEYNIEGSLRFYHKQFLTFYQFDTMKLAQTGLQAFLQRPGREEEKAEWRKWEASFIQLEHSTLYKERYTHPRLTWDGPFGSRPFFCVTVDMRPEADEERFNTWYETVYLPKNLADVPTWTSCRRYESQNRSPSRHLTIYEAWDEAGLQRSLQLMRAPSRFEENTSWQQWDTGEKSAIIWEDASSFRPIFRYPH